ncbi:PAS domain-containing sensor histidine kinase [Pedobacter sp.]|uniref:PAS domain-containing sensor histidine kinase n=1 Tax=Pedobacter sp. TaxID=1411316 RepID=UPI003D7F3444
MDEKEGLILKQMTLQAEEIFFVFNVKEMRFTYVNKAFESITKRKITQLLEQPKTILKIIHPEDLQYIKNAYKIVSRKKTSTSLSFRILRPDHLTRWIRAKIYAVVEHDEVQYISGVAEDDSARIANIFNMQKVNGWKNSTLEILSHDLRGPIGTVKMLASVIAKKLPDNAEITKLTELIEDISRRNIELIKTVLKRETFDTAEVELSKERLDVVWEIQQIMEIYMKSQEAVEKKLEFTFSHPTIHAELDSMKFLQIVNNLVSNAIKFTHKQGHIHVHVEKLEKTVLVTVADDGIGIPRNLRPVLFHKYTRASRPGVEGEESIGLGMWIVKLLTEIHNGRVWFESEENKGSTFYVEVPLGHVEAD